MSFLPKPVSVEYKYKCQQCENSSVAVAGVKAVFGFPHDSKGTVVLGYDSLKTAPQNSFSGDSWDEANSACCPWENGTPPFSPWEEIL